MSHPFQTLRTCPENHKDKHPGRLSCSRDPLIAAFPIRDREITATGPMSVYQVHVHGLAGHALRTVLFAAAATLLNLEPVAQADDGSNISNRMKEEQAAGAARQNAAKDRSSDTKKERNIDAISDNAFIIEEAYNQEAGVVQHITTATRGINRANGEDVRSWNMSFTQEWPLWSQAHQFSYTIPYGTETSPGPEGNNGPRDVLLNYRYQLLMETDRQPAISPRLSAVLPTGNLNDGFGSDTYGLQFNLPISKALNDELRAHFNAGLTYLPDVDRLLTAQFDDATGALIVQNRSARQDLMGYNLGFGLHYAPFPKVHFLLESTLNWDQAINAGDGARNENFGAVIMPGVRYAIDLPECLDLQIVLGVGAPIGLTRDAVDYGALFYLSIEHDFVTRK